MGLIPGQRNINKIGHGVANFSFFILKLWLEGWWEDRLSTEPGALQEGWSPTSPPSSPRPPASYSMWGGCRSVRVNLEVGETKGYVYKTTSHEFNWIPSNSTLAHPPTFPHSLSAGRPILAGPLCLQLSVDTIHVLSCEPRREHHSVDSTPRGGQSCSPTKALFSVTTFRKAFLRLPMASLFLLAVPEAFPYGAH